MPDPPRAPTEQSGRQTTGVTGQQALPTSSLTSWTSSTSVLTVGRTAGRQGG
jgi:hypothetical protein